ncbi:uncharacterized protein LOC120678398 [Panicum virgatum]|uniref:uncharacterized protein LOC120678398 n=1 Tax=Panicum virgatum TaxID=38727 RepID=UPI0019D6859F|nr:uncharacterized protein LOC120678398 [Panicum virgatum]
MGFQLPHLSDPTLKRKGQLSLLKNKSPMDDKLQALKAYRKAKGLCYKCGEKWNPGHKCHSSVTLHAMEEVWQLCSKTISSELEDSDSGEDLCTVSLQAMHGVEGAKTIRLRGFVQHQEASLLVDSGSTTCFINEMLAADIPGWRPLPKPLHVTVANGTMLWCTHEIPDLLWAIQGHSFRTTFKVFPLGNYDAILGMDWLESFSPMQVHWKSKWLLFEHNNSTVKLQGVSPQTILGPPISPPQVNAMLKNKSILYMVHLNAVEVTSQAEPTLHPDIQALLSQFCDLFQEPTSVPPPRLGDHQIPLIAGAQPFRLRPYRYSPALKDEIEKQVSEMLQKG